MSTFKRIIAVDKGNTCRGPMAATILQDLLKDDHLIVQSRGMVVLFPEPYNPKAVAVTAAHHMIMPSDRSVQLKEEDFGQDTLILVMNQSMKQKLYHTFPKALNVFSMTEFAGVSEEEVPDPYGKGMDEYNQCFLGLFDLGVKIRERLHAEEREKRGK
jgi:protein-tyrosine-phosphatase